jgi:sec-independent protein translocase protein TatA
MLGDLFTGWHLIIVLALVLLLFGAAKLPALAKGVGQSVRIFRGEMKSMDADAKADAVPDAAASTPVAPAASVQAPVVPPVQAPVVESPVQSSSDSSSKS